jgi:Phosphotransferase enzyme family
MSQPEELLDGWNGVVRIGNTVRRPARPWSRTVQGLLGHLASKGFDAGPRPLGFDEQGREILSYLPGSAGHYPWREFVYSKDNLYRVARLLRRYHDLTASFPIPREAVWFAQLPGPPEAICHGDIGPYNTVYIQQAAVALIDFDTAAPGPRIWDVAFAAYRFARVCELSTMPRLNEVYLHQVSQQIRRFCDYYGLEDRTALLDVMLQRLEFQISWLGAPANLTTHRKAVAETHAAFFCNEVRAISRHARELKRHL